ncbi:MAG: ATP-binding cassette, subfamily bacterial [Frankiaceae bacterium]|nr:ATP-binding cassette, subfamily bacterial [Frankiaceae bacterium]
MRAGTVKTVIDAARGQGRVGGPKRPRPSVVATRYRSLYGFRTYLRPFRWQMWVMFAAAFAMVAAATLVPLVIKAAVNGPIARGDRGAMVPVFLAALGLGVVECVLIFARRYIQSIAVLRVETNIRDDLYQHLQRLAVAFHDQWQTGQLLSRATTDLSSIRRFLGFGAIFLVVNVVQYVAVVALLIATYAPLGLVVAGMTIPVIWLAQRFGNEYSLLARRMQDQQGDLATAAEEAASGIRVTKAFGRGALLHSQFVRQAEVVRGSALEMVALRGRFWALLELIPNIVMALVVLIGGLAVAHHSMSLGALVAFTTLLVLLQWPIIDIGWILSMAQEASTAADRIQEVFRTVPAVTDPVSPTPLPEPTPQRPSGHLVFDHVSFAFPDADEPTLRDIDLDLAPGETLAIVGATGSGKTALTALPARLYDVTAGRITLDGVDIRDLALTDLRSRIATAFEDPVLFSMSVRENLVLGRPDATDADIDAAIDLAQADFVHALPWGLDTRIGEQGLSLSGGQRQRLALARAVLAQPTVLVLDDPLSALDVHTEAKVEAALARVLRDTTAIVVVHRPSTVALADRVALLEDGRITAIGTHSELMRLPAYAEVLSVDPDDVSAGACR